MVKLFSNIKFLIIIFFIVRLFGITNPPLEVEHSWRQVTTNMYARNFLEVDNNIFFARIDFAGYKSGVTAKEFPFFNYLIYIVSLLFGFSHWYGRLINLLVTSVGIYFFYLIIKEIHLKSTAFYSTLILLCSLWFSYSRKILPDTFSMSITIISLYFAFQYLTRGGFYRILLFGILGLIGTLSKIPSLYIFGPFIIFVFLKGFPKKRQFFFFLSSAVIISTNLWWYFYWIPYVTNLTGIVHYPMVSISQGVNDIFSNILPTLNRFYFTSLKSFIAFAVFIYGTYLAIKKKELLMVYLLLIGFISFLPFIFKSGFNFYHHSYYVTPFVPVMAVLAGYGLSQIKRKYILSILLAGIFIESIANQQHDFFIRKTELYKLSLEQIADSISSPNDLIAIQGINGNPQELYFTHRKGWMYNQDKLKNDEYINRLAKEGCKYIFVNKRNYIEPGGTKEIVYEDEFYKIFRISPE